MDLLSRFLNPILGIVLTVLFGFWLSRRGRPYPGLLFNVHKLVALGTVVLAGIFLFRIMEGPSPETHILMPLSGAVICVAALFASGALMSAGKGKYKLLKTIHLLTPFALVLTLGLSIVRMV